VNRHDGQVTLFPLLMQVADDSRALVKWMTIAVHDEYTAPAA
jgi:hypothetical protein